jgi:DNA replication protein
MKPNVGLRQGLFAVLKEGTASVPVLLLKHYREWKLSETETMLLIHVISFIEKEQKEFPTLEELLARMTAPETEVIAALQKLLKEGFLRIDGGKDPVTGIQFERYNLDPLYEKLAERAAAEWERLSPGRSGASSEGRDIYTVIEQEFGRPLTPMELETISSWLDKDGYKEDLIRAALKEAVFAGKVHFRYIDRILLEWSRNRVYTVEQAKEYTKQYRGNR